MSHASASEVEHTGTFWVLDLDRPIMSSSPARLPVKLQRVGPEHAEELAAAMGVASPAVILERFARGCQCYVVYLNEGKILASYGWVSFDQEEIGELGIRIRLSAGRAYIWDCATLPPYRGQRLYPALLIYIARVLQRQGLRRLWIGADANNTASRRGIEVAGFQAVADVTRIAVSRTKTRYLLRRRPGVSEEVLQDLRQSLPPTVELVAPEDESRSA
ncbi:GNAT family N-acetyltransferase [Thermogemmatispora sp.]|uniref:GNAT family N-acetyltransferase n=1 Tax=Thermogemmatispora sp. TaxID=1968838 RepID=UPI001D7C8908|nr:GNAT family N-acetyltransferase [Thermogemmatispora sp.]MBX5451990.1 GNAT family N-acetyltransferase [Thermogemmatispora sp.]